MATTDYRRMRVKRFAPIEERETPEGRYWRKFKNPITENLLAPATTINFCPAAPHDFAVTAGARVALYDHEACKERKSLSRFKDTVYSGNFRDDGRLLCAGSARGLVHVVDVTTKAMLRRFRGHRGPVQTTRFASDAVHLLSAGDDCTIRYWDISAERAVGVLPRAHADYIRCAHSSAVNHNLWATGSFDHTVKLWDARTAFGRGDATGSASSSVATATLDAPNDDENDGDGDDDAAASAATATVEGDASVSIRRSHGDADDDGSNDDDSNEDDGDDNDDADDSHDDENDGLIRTGQTAGRGVFSDADDDGDDADTVVIASSSSARSTSAAASSLSLGGGGGSGGSGGPLLSVDHGEPVTRVLLLPGGGTLLTAGGTSLKLWDVLRGGRLLATVSAHLKTITSLALDGTGTRLLSGGLDGLVKVYELASYGVTHTMRYDSPVVSLAVSPDNTRLVVGTADSVLTMRSRPLTQADKAREQKAARSLRGGSYKYYARGQGTLPAEDDIRVEQGRKQRLRPYDSALRGFAYGAALDEAVATRNASVISGMLEELVARSALGIALGGRDEESLQPLLGFLVKHVADPRFSDTLVDVTHVLLDMYAPIIGQSRVVDDMLGKIAVKASDEAALGEVLMGLNGQLELLMAGGSHT